MALDAHRRSSIHRKLVPLLGEEDADALLAEFPLAPADGPATARSVRVGFSAARPEGSVLRADFDALRTELTWRMIAIVAIWVAVLGPLFLLT